MDLKDFIKETIKGIVIATNELNQELADYGAIIDPHSVYFENVSNVMYHKSKPEQNGSLIHNVEFCLTVAESKELNAKGGIGIKVIDGGISHTTGNENHNTVKFSIPVVYSIDAKTKK